jgi:hypothetical protein
MNESALLQKINEGFSEAFWQRYRSLIAQRNTETFSAEEREELIGLSDQIEARNLERTEHLIALAEYRGVPLQELVQQLGLRPTAVE